jgi:hypothetical protein
MDFAFVNAIISLAALVSLVLGMVQDSGGVE